MCENVELKLDLIERGQAMLDGPGGTYGKGEAIEWFRTPEDIIVDCRVLVETKDGTRYSPIIKSIENDDECIGTVVDKDERKCVHFIKSNVLKIESEPNKEKPA